MLLTLKTILVGYFNFTPNSMNCLWRAQYFLGLQTLVHAKHIFRIFHTSGEHGEGGCVVPHSDGAL